MLKLTIHSVGMGSCSLSGKEGDGLNVAFGDEQPSFLVWKSMQQLVNMKLRQKPEARPVAPVGNGAPVVK